MYPLPRHIQFFLWVRFYDSISCFKNLRPQRTKTSSYHPSKPPTIYKKRHHLNSLLRAKDTHGQLPEFGNSWPTDSSYPEPFSPAHSPPANSTNAIPCTRSIFGAPEKARTPSAPQTIEAAAEPNALLPSRCLAFPHFLPRSRLRQSPGPHPASEQNPADKALPPRRKKQAVGKK